MRKYQACGTGISQNIEDLLQSHTARTMLANSEFLIMLNQAATDREELARLLAVLEPRCREEWRAGFPNVKERLAAEEAQKQGGEPA